MRLWLNSGRSGCDRGCISHTTPHRPRDRTLNVIFRVWLVVGLGSGYVSLPVVAAATRTKKVGRSSGMAGARLGQRWNWAVLSTLLSFFAGRTGGLASAAFHALPRSHRLPTDRASCQLLLLRYLPGESISDEKNLFCVHRQPPFVASVISSSTCPRPLSSTTVLGRSRISRCLCPPDHPSLLPSVCASPRRTARHLSTRDCFLSTGSNSLLKKRKPHRVL